MPAAERPRVVQQLHTELAMLHAGNAVRFGLRPLDWQAWQQRVHPPR